MAMTKEELEAAVPKEEVQAPARRTKVAVLGFTDTWKLAPFNDPEFEIWGLNELYQFIPRWDRWFDIHQRSIYANDRNRVHDHIQKLAAMTCPIYMQQHWDDIPNSVPYPLEIISKAFPNPCADARPYLTNSITYMLLLAVLEGFEEVHCYGVDMAHDCLAPDMRVLTADLRWVPAGDLKLGQELLAFDEHGTARGLLTPARRLYRKAKVLSLSTGTRPCHRFEMGNGKSIISSQGHQWLHVTQDNSNWQLPYDESAWQKTRNLFDGDMLLELDPLVGIADTPLCGKPTHISTAKYIGNASTIGITTDTQTLIVEGFASHNSEYGSQRPSCEWAVGIAQGRGIKTYIPHEADLLKTNFLYGYEADAAHAFDRKLAARKSEMEKKLNELDVQIANLTEARAQYRGAVQDAEHIIRNWKSN